MRFTLLLAALICSLSLYPRHKPQRTYFEHTGLLRDTTVTLAPRSALSPASPWRLEARLAIKDLKERKGTSKESWSLSVCSASDTLRAHLQWANSDFGDFLDRRFTLLTISLGDSILLRKEVDQFSTAPAAFNTICLNYNPDSQHLSIQGGANSLSTIAQLPLPPEFLPSQTSITINGTATLSLFCIETTVPIFGEAQIIYPDIPALASHIALSTDPTEGLWQLLDRDNDPSRARLGGRYSLATIADSDGSYLIILIDGAQVNQQSWSPGMLKGKLKPTIFKNHFDLEWIDAEFKPITTDIYADIIDGAILRLSFPLYNTTIRFSKSNP
ncbi:MAG: hypothetical protein J1E29_07725 [Duncaniella sp.]|nr:hypothetical protein [Duncaniella sp.]